MEETKQTSANSVSVPIGPAPGALPPYPPQPSPTPANNNPTPPSTESNGFKAALIAFGLIVVINIFPAAIIGVLASGIYLGLAKDKGKLTYLTFFIISLVFILFSTTYLDLGDPHSKSLGPEIIVFAILLESVGPILLASIIRKFRKK